MTRIFYLYNESQWNYIYNEYERKIMIQCIINMNYLMFSYEMLAAVFTLFFNIYNIKCRMVAQSNNFVIILQNCEHIQRAGNPTPFSTFLVLSSLQCTSLKHIRLATTGRPAYIYSRSVV